MNATIETNYTAYVAGTKLGDLPAVTLEDDGMDAYLADFDARHANDDVETPTVIGGKSDPVLTKIIADYDRRNPVATYKTPLHKAYVQYINDGLADTDGRFAPLSFEEWKLAQTVYLPTTPDYRTQGATIRPKVGRGKGASGETRKRKKFPRR